MVPAMKRLLALSLTAGLLVGCAAPVPTPTSPPSAMPAPVARPTTAVNVTVASPVPLAAATMAPTPPPAAAAKPAQPTAPTAAAAVTTPSPDYMALRMSLLTPLGGLIVATREKSPQTPAFRAQFNTAGEKVLEAIKGDMSVNGNRLHSAVINTQEAASRGDLAELERQRLELLKIPGA